MMRATRLLLLATPVGAAAEMPPDASRAIEDPPKPATNSTCCGGLFPFLDAANHSALALTEIMFCKDNQIACKSWAAGGECTKNAGFMRAECRKSCNACGLSAEDAVGAAELALVMLRNLALACEYGSAGLSADDTCKWQMDWMLDGDEVTTKEALWTLRDAKVSEAQLRELAAATLHRVEITCRKPKRCLLGEEPHMVPAAVLTPTDFHPVRTKRLPTDPPPEDFYTLPHGVKLPKLGLGTWLSTGAECTAMVAAALRVGFRHIDTSENYANHEAIGAALKASSVPRAELFLADKISLPGSYSAQGVREWVRTSLSLLGTDYLDLLMLHSVGPSPNARLEAWRELEKLRVEGVVRAIGTSNLLTPSYNLHAFSRLLTPSHALSQVRAIGTSNFGVADMQALRAEASEPPATAQIKFNPYHPGRTGNRGGDDFAADCKANGCVITPYCPLNSWPSKIAPVDDRWVAHIAERYQKTPAQVLLRWAVQQGHAPLTRSRNETRLREALEVLQFQLHPFDADIISSLVWQVESEFHQPPMGDEGPTVPDTFGILRLGMAKMRAPRGVSMEREEL